MNGVTIFFVLSGYLITRNLLERNLSLRGFYIRRYFRLMPVVWCYLLFLLLLQSVYHYPNDLTAGSLSALLCYNNFAPGGPATGHFWSLSIEEQFYLVWPALLVLCGRRKALWLAIGGALAVAAYRFANWQYFDQMKTAGLTQARADALLVGCALALALDRPKLRRMADRIFPVLWLCALGYVAYCILCFHMLSRLSECIAIAVLIGVSVVRPESLLAKGLSVSPLVWVGKISYSVYVWQQLFIPMGDLNYSPWTALAVPIFSITSYYVVEQPLRRMGRRLEARLNSRKLINVAG